MKPGQGVPQPGVHIQDAVRDWAVQKLTEKMLATQQPTSVIGDLDLSTLTIQFVTEVSLGEPSAENPVIILRITADTQSGGPFRADLPWNPIGATNTMTEIIQHAGGVVHA